MREKIFNLVITYKKTVIVIFSIVTILSSIALLFVEVNYSMVDYFPDDAPSTVAIDTMEEEDQLRVMVENVSILETLEAKTLR